jgi:hypothetical protein
MLSSLFSLSCCFPTVAFNLYHLHCAQSEAAFEKGKGSLSDRAYSFQKHGIVEPKQRDIIGKRKGGSMRGKKEYEAHAYKRLS